MSKHFKQSLALTGLLAIILAGAFLWLKRKVERVIHIPSIPQETGLAADEAAIVRFNEKTHRVTITTSSGTVKMYARNPTIRVKNDGRVVVNRHIFGFQARPFIGIGYSDTTRALIGFEPVYWGAFDASISAGISLDNEYVFAKPYVAVGYNCWGNLSVNGGVNPAGIKQLDVILFMSVKL